MSIPTSFAQTLPSNAASIICLSIAIGAPLLTIASTYDLHLFPGHDAIEYDPSTTHLVSQLMHCLSLAFFITSFLLGGGTLLFQASVSSRTIRSGAVAVAVLATMGFVTHLVALGSLAKVATDWKRKLEDLPLPPLDLPLSYRSGIISDGVGLVASAATAFIAWLTVRRVEQESYVRLE